MKELQNLEYVVPASSKNPGDDISFLSSGGAGGLRRRAPREFGAQLFSPNAIACLGSSGLDVWRYFGRHFLCAVDPRPDMPLPNRLACFLGENARHCGLPT
jgi:hypothetical protein